MLERHTYASPQCATQAVLAGNAAAVAWLTQAVRQARAGMQALAAAAASRYRADQVSPDARGGG